VARIVVVAPGGDSPAGLRSPPCEIHRSAVGPLLGLPSPLLIPFRVRTVEHPEASIVVNPDLILVSRILRNPLYLSYTISISSLVQGRSLFFISAHTFPKDSIPWNTLG
jgi:hypothetical protein